MAYTKFHSDWKNFPDTSTPLEADALDHIEAGIAAAIASPASIASGEAAVWNGSDWVRSSVTKLGLSSIAQGGATTGQAMVWNGSAWAPSSTSPVIDRVFTDATFASSTAENSVYSKSIAGNTIGATGILRFTANGLWSDVSGTDTERIRLKFGGTTIIDTGAVVWDSTGGNTNRPWEMWAFVQNDNATNAQSVVWHLWVANGSNAPTTGTGSSPARAQHIMGQIRNTATIDTTSSQTLDITWQHGQNSANNSVTLHSAILELL